MLGFPTQINSKKDLLMSTTNDFALYKRLLSGIKPYRWMFFVGILATTATSGIDAGLAWLIKPIINEGLIDKNQAFIRILPLIIVTAFTVRGMAVFFSSYFISKVGRSVIMDYRQRIFKHLLKLPASFYDKQSSGQLLSRLIYNVEQISEATTYAILIIVQESVLAIGLLIVMFTLSWQLTLIFMVVFPLMAWLVRYTSKRLRKLSTGVLRSVGEVSHIAEESIEGYRVIRTFGGESYEAEKFIRATHSNKQQEMKVIVTNSLGTASVQIVISFSISLILALATSPAIDVSAGAFAALVAAMFTLLRPVRRINQINNIIQKGLAGAQSIFELLDIPPETDNGTQRIQRAKGNIVFRDVCFTYPGTEKEVLKNISFSIQPGETVALVGRSGSGKSTLVSLLPRFYDIEKGEILIDGLNIKDYQLADLRNQFASVSQQVTLFNDTILKNIGYGKLQEIDEDTVKKAAKAAHALEFINELPNGFETLVGEDGVLLSGGQRQRLAIARALLKDAPILILDEATSALDTESEKYIQSGLEQLMHNRTTLVIAHRLSTIENADKILVMDKGEIVESGTHHSLLAQGGHYARLHALQFKERDAIHSEI
jgi:subfamily B ATP-binding cassette protein MsbA